MVLGQADRKIGRCRIDGRPRMLPHRDAGLMLGGFFDDKREKAKKIIASSPMEPTPAARLDKFTFCKALGLDWGLVS